jgi:hypothetical protein
LGVRGTLDRLGDQDRVLDHEFVEKELQQGTAETQQTARETVFRSRETDAHEIRWRTATNHG